MDMYVGACLYCGQTSGIPGQYESQEEADKAATKSCRCYEARMDRAAEASRNKLRGLLAYQPQAVVDTLIGVLNMIAACMMASATVQIDGRTKMKIKADSKGNVVVQKVTTTVEQEVV